jgi:LDH2 family malate/lactate/ureidoglycolate dehydrogenase
MFSARVDGDNGPGQWVAMEATELAIRKAKESGVGIVTVRRSNHFGAAGHYAWEAARRGLIGICTTNGPLVLAPLGGTTPTFGNNPLGVGLPARNHFPVLLDIAMSVAPRGKIGLHLAEGKPLPKGWILDQSGRPTTDLADLAAGLGVPIGAHKGYGLALVLEALSGVLSGAGFCLDHAHKPSRERPFDTGHFVLVVDPERFLPPGDFTVRIDRMIDCAHASARAEGAGEILVPGEMEMRARERHLIEGVPLRRSTYQSLTEFARKVGLQSELSLAGGTSATTERPVKPLNA